MIDNTRTGQNITAHRQRMGWTQGELAARLNVTHQAVSKWENAAALPDIATLLALSRLFGVSMEELLTGEAPASAPAQKADTASSLPEEIPSDRRPENCAPPSGSAEHPAVAEANPIPVQSTSTPEEKSTGNACDWNHIIALAPFTSRDALARLVQSCADQCDFNHIMALAPFLPRETVDRLVQSCVDRCDFDHLIALAPFLPRETVDRLLLGNSAPAPSSGFSGREAERQFDEAFRAEHGRSFEEQFTHEHQEEIDRQAVEAEAEARYIEQQIEKDIEQMAHEIERQIEEEVLQIEASEERLEEMARQAERHAKQHEERMARRAETYEERMAQHAERHAKQHEERMARRAETYEERMAQHAERHAKQHEERMARRAEIYEDRIAQHAEQHARQHEERMARRAEAETPTEPNPLGAVAPLLKEHMGEEAFRQLTESLKSAAAGLKGLDAFAPFLAAHMSPNQFSRIREAADAASRSAESQLPTPAPSDRRTEIRACRTLAELADRIAAQLYAACDATDPMLGRIDEIRSAIIGQDYRALDEFAPFLDRHVGPEWLEEMAELGGNQPIPDDLAAQIDRAIAQRNWDWIEQHAHEITDKELIRRIALISSAEGYFDLIPLFIDELDQASFDHAARQAVRLNRPDDVLPFAHRVSPGILK